MTTEAKLREKVRRLEAALQDIARHGTRHDLTPTRRMYIDNPKAMEVDEWWSNYLRSADKNVREQAQRTLAENLGELV